MNDADLSRFKKECISAIKEETHIAIKHTGHSWIKDAVREIVPLVMHDTLTKLGIQPEPPFESQKDFAYLRQSRIDSEDTKKNIRKSVQTYLVNGGISLIVAGAASWVMIKSLVAKVP